MGKIGFNGLLNNAGKTARAEDHSGSLIYNGRDFYLRLHPLESGRYRLKNGDKITMSYPSRYGNLRTFEVTL